MLAAIIARLEAQVPALAGRVGAAADLSELMQQNRLPQHGLSAMVVPLGLRGGRESSATGLFIQSIEDIVGILLTYRAAMREADAVSDLGATIRSVAEALVGWQPGSEIGVFRLMRGSILSAQGGTLIYQLDFAIPDQLRVTP